MYSWRVWWIRSSWLVRGLSYVTHVIMRRWGCVSPAQVLRDTDVGRSPPHVTRRASQETCRQVPPTQQLVRTQADAPRRAGPDYQCVAANVGT